MGDHRDRRGALQTQAFDVPADPREDPVPGRSEGREVGHRGSGHEPDARLGGQSEELHEPSPGDLLGDGGCGRQSVEPAVLVPGARQPVGADRRGQAPPDDEAEIARAGTGDESWFGGRGQVLDDRQRVARIVGQRTAHRRPERSQVDRSADRSGGERAQVGAGDIGRAG